MANSIVGERLRYIRESRNLTAEQVARDLNIKPDTYRGYERGIRDLRVGVLMEICAYFDVEANYFVGHSDIPFSTKGIYTAGESQKAYSEVTQAMEVISRFILTRSRQK